MRASELREVELRQKDGLISKKEHELDVQAIAIDDQQNDLSEKLTAVKEKEKSVVFFGEKEVVLQKTMLQKENDDVNCTKNELQDSLRSLDNRGKEISYAGEKVEAMRTKTNELIVLEGKIERRN